MRTVQRAAEKCAQARKKWQWAQTLHPLAWKEHAIAKSAYEQAITEYKRMLDALEAPRG